jgi:hypothetical protein
MILVFLAFFGGFGGNELVEVLATQAYERAVELTGQLPFKPVKSPKLGFV